MSSEKSYVIKVGDKEIEINEDVLSILHRYVHTEMSLEQLASELGFESWEEAYEFVKKVPAWILWISPSLWKTLKGMKRASEELAHQK